MNKKPTYKLTYDVTMGLPYKPEHKPEKKTGLFRSWKQLALVAVGCILVGLVIAVGLYVYVEWILLG